MQFVVLVATLFVIGSVAGYLTEVLYRRFVSRKIWMNPGFLVGPYLPIYGTGVVALFLISNVNLGIENAVFAVVLKVLLIGVMMTLIEFIAGLIFIKGLKIKLWDYSNQKGNIMGIICPVYSLIWLVVGSLYYFFLNPILLSTLSWLSENLIYTFFIGAVVGMMVVDFAYSLHLGLKIQQFRELQGMRFEEFKKTLRDKRDGALNKLKAPKNGNENA